MTRNSGDICLKWNNHQASVLFFLDSFYQKSSLVDVTLAADGKFIQVHRLVLCACSPYFEELLSHQTEKQAIIFLKDVSYNDLKHLVDFIYKGEVNVSEQELTNFLATARSLKIKGLGSNKDSVGESCDQPTHRASDAVKSQRPLGGSSKKAKKRKVATQPAAVEADPLSTNEISQSQISQVSSEDVTVIGTKTFNSSSNDIRPGDDPLASRDPLSTPGTSEEVIVDDDSFVDIQSTDQENGSGTPTTDGNEDMQQALQFASLLAVPPGATPRVPGRSSCMLCLRQFKDRKALSRHVSLCGTGGLYACVICGKKYQMKDYLLRHVRTHAVDGTSSSPLK